MVGPLPILTDRQIEVLRVKRRMLLEAVWNESRLSNPFKLAGTRRKDQVRGRVRAVLQVLRTDRDLAGGGRPGCSLRTGIDQIWVSVQRRVVVVVVFVVLVIVGPGKIRQGRRAVLRGGVITPQRPRGRGISHQRQGLRRRMMMMLMMLMHGGLAVLEKRQIDRLVMDSMGRGRTRVHFRRILG